MVIYEDRFYPVMLYNDQQVYFNPVSYEVGIKKGMEIERPDIFEQRLMYQEGLQEAIDDMLMESDE